MAKWSFVLTLKNRFHLVCCFCSKMDSYTNMHTTDQEGVWPGFGQDKPNSHFLKIWKKEGKKKGGKKGRGKNEGKKVRKMGGGGEEEEAKGKKGGGG